MKQDSQKTNKKLPQLPMKKIKMGVLVLLTWVVMELSLAYISPHLSSPGLQIPRYDTETIVFLSSKACSLHSRDKETLPYHLFQKQTNKTS